MSTQIITRVIKDEPAGKVVYSGLRLICHYCKNSIAGEPLCLGLMVMSTTSVADHV
jgi:hypothetical protein